MKFKGDTELTRYVWDDVKKSSFLSNLKDKKSSTLEACGIVYFTNFIVLNGYSSPTEILDSKFIGGYSATGDSFNYVDLLGNQHVISKEDFQFLRLYKDNHSCLHVQNR